MVIYIPTVLRDCILLSIPKGNKDPTLSDNYYPVARPTVNHGTDCGMDSVHVLTGSECML